MHKSYFIAKYIAAAIFLIFLLGGCALWDRLFSEQEKSPAELMTEAMEDFEGGDLKSATETFQKIKDRYPYSKHAVGAELRMADSLYKRKLYDEAFDAYTEFERLHPTNKDIPYVIYQKGMCDFSQASTIDRDQSHILKAKQEFERLVKRFPRTTYARMARRKLRDCYISLAEYELYVGHYYYKMKKYGTAMMRYKYLIKNYPDLGQYHEALEYLRKCEQKLTEEKKSTGRWWLPDFFSD
ncbi:MAG: outer membrane protein assembly factor BamD [Thermodesulfobacteriota bacterium]|nr:outer membrane protein assembly factor BamD [Thermodesulfobacteriota bacterium]